MILRFGSTLLEAFGHCKIIRATESFRADHDNQTIKQDGIVFASISVPTVRSIDVDVLVRGNNHPEVMKKLQDIHSWLFNAGVDELYLDKGLTYFYKARCVLASPPEYSGFSARLTFTFECTDFRQYNARTGLPIESSTAALQNFKFAGKHCLTDLGCMFLVDNFDGSPSAIVNKYDISGVSGTLRYDAKSAVLKERTMSGILYFVNTADPNLPLTTSQITERLHSVASFLLRSGRASLVLDEDITREYQAEVLLATQFDQSAWKNGSLKVKFELQPISRDVAASVLSGSHTLVANTNKDIPLTALFARGVSWETPLYITILNTGATPITDLNIQYKDKNNVDAVCRITGSSFSLSGATPVIIDTENYTILRAAVSWIKSLYSGELPSIFPNTAGTFSIQIKSNVATTVTVTVTTKARWV